MIYTEYDPLESVIVGDTYTPEQISHLLTNHNASQFNKILKETRGINKSQLNREKRMADKADDKFYIRGGTSRRKGVPTTTFHCRICVKWVNALFHRVHTFD